MTQVVLSIGSNIDREQHISYAIDALRSAFGKLIISPVYETRSVGFDGPDFHNLVVAMQSSLSFEAVRDKIRQIESNAGRERGMKTYSSRNLDIDVLLFGDKNLRAQGINVPRDEIEHAAYVLCPLADILPQAVHLVLGETYAEMWQAFMDKEDQGLKRTDIVFPTQSYEAELKSRHKELR